MQKGRSQRVGRIRGPARNDRSQEMIKPQLRRLYVLSWLGWGLWCLYWPIYNQDQQAEKLRALNLQVFKSCLDSDPDHEHCWKAKEKVEKELEESEVSPYGEWKIAIPFLAGLILIPPLIVYGLLFRAVPWLVRWVWEWNEPQKMRHSASHSSGSLQKVGSERRPRP